MKKILLFALVLGIGVNAMAQVKQIQPKDWYSTYTLMASEPVAEPMPVYESESNIYVTSERAEDIVIGETYYDLQSNSSMAQRIYTFDDGTKSAVWTMSHETDGFPACPDRGTGYNYHDGTDWGPMPEARVEPDRNGWPTIQPYGENGEIIVSHTGGNPGLIFSHRPEKGTGDWTHFYLPGPATQPDLLWPRMVTSGENNDVIHVIACAGNAVEYEGLTMALLYSRSDDGGETWDPQNAILDGMGSDYTSGWGGDDYAWAMPHGDTLAFIAFGGIKDGVIMKSTDGGDNWERITFYESPDPFFDGNGGDLPQCGGGDGYNAIVLDNDGMAHVAFGRQIHLDDTPDDDSWSYFPYSDGLIFWSEGDPALDTAAVTAEILPSDWSTHPLYLSGNLAAWTQPNGEDTISAVAPYYASLTSMPTLAHHVDDMGYDIFQIFYGALSVGYVNPDPEAPNNFRHIWGVRTEGDGMWSDFTDYTGDIFHLFLESVYPSVSQNIVNDTYDVLYQTDALPGNALQPNDTPTHEPVLNKLVYLPVTPLPVDVPTVDAARFEVSQNHPNPAINNTYVTVNIETQGLINFTVSNLLGQVVYTETKDAHTLGTHTFGVDVSSFESGIYLYTVEMGNNSITKKMLVK